MTQGSTESSVEASFILVRHKIKQKLQVETCSNRFRQIYFAEDDFFFPLFASSVTCLGQSALTSRHSGLSQIETTHFTASLSCSGTLHTVRRVETLPKHVPLEAWRCLRSHGGKASLVFTAVGDLAQLLIVALSHLAD